MTWALFLGCRIPAALPAYGVATRAVLARLGVDVVDDVPFDCCGYPARDLDREAGVRLAARNLARAAARGVDVLAPCKCCYGQLRHAAHALERDPALRDRVAASLAREGIPWRDGARVEHLLGVLDREVGVEAIAAVVTTPQTGRRVAASYGCHALRPSDVVRLDNPLAPQVFERLVAATGAQPVDWPRRLDCCGRPLHARNAPLALRLARAKVADAREAGADLLCTACTWCQLQLDEYAAGAAPDADPTLATLLYPQLLGLALGLPPETLGLADGADRRLAPPGDDAAPGAAPDALVVAWQT